MLMSPITPIALSGADLLAGCRPGQPSLHSQSTHDCSPSCPLQRHHTLPAGTGSQCLSAVWTQHLVVHSVGAARRLPAPYEKIQDTGYTGSCSRARCRRPAAGSVAVAAALALIAKIEPAPCSLQAEHSIALPARRTPPWPGTGMAAGAGVWLTI